jgi:hypothetical protein
VRAAAVLAAARRRYHWMLPPAVVSASLLTIVWIGFRNRVARMQESLNHDLKDNPFRGLAEAMTGSVRLEWGWAVMFAGAAVLFVGALIDRKRVTWPALCTTLVLFLLAALYAYIEL